MKMSRTAISVETRWLPSAAGDVHGRNGGAAVADPQIDRLGAVEGGGLRSVAVVERPGAGGADRHRAGQPDHDRMVDRRQIAFLDVVAGAGLADAAGEVDAEPVDDVARPAAAVALQLPAPVRRRECCGRARSRRAAGSRAPRGTGGSGCGPPTKSAAAPSRGRLRFAPMTRAAPASTLTSSATVQRRNERERIPAMARLTLAVRQK